MKKTIPITIGGTLFYIEEDAYAKLKDYLDSVKGRFASFEDNEEIIADIESRIAEQFSENSTGTKEKIVTMAEVEKLISVMGQPSDFEDAPQGQKKSSSTGSQETGKTGRRLFRDTDNAVVAGVASGIAAYFGIDPAIVRIIFVVVVLLGGSGILVYLILWIAIPEAKTATEKLQMRGEPVTLESVNQVVKEKVEEVKKNGGLKKVSNFFGQVIAAVFRVVGKILRKIVGIALVAASVFGIFWVIFVFAVTLFNINSPYVDFPLAEVVSGPLFYVGLCALFLASIIPLIFVNLAGLSLTQRKNNFSAAPSVSLFSIWLLSLIAMGVVATKIAPEYQNYIETSPEYKTVTQSYDLKDFTGVKAKNGSRVKITQGPNFVVSASAAARDLAELNAHVEDGVLVLERKHGFKICVFCMTDRASFTIQMPTIAALSGENATRIETDLLSSENISVTLENASRIKMSGNFGQIKLTSENGSSAELSGNASSSAFTLENASRLHAKDLSVQNAAIEAHNGSSAEVMAIDKLNVKAYNGSYIIYYGAPKVSQITRNGSRVTHASDLDTAPEEPEQPQPPISPIAPIPEQ